MIIAPAEYELMRQCILSEQMPHDVAMRMLSEDADFAEWYSRNRKEKKMNADI